MDKIVIKEVDMLASALHKDKVVSEYLIYAMIDGSSQPLEAYTEFGDLNKNARVNEILLTHFIFENPDVNKEDIIEEIGFEEYAKELKKIWKNNTP